MHRSTSDGKRVVPRARVFILVFYGHKHLLSYKGTRHPAGKLSDGKEQTQ